MERLRHWLEIWLRSPRPLFLTLIALWCTFIVVSGDAGFNDDSRQLHEYGHQLLDYYLSGFKKSHYPQILANPRNANEQTERFYGALFELSAAFLERFVFPGVDPFRVRHAWTAFFLGLGLLFLVLIALRLGSTPLGWLVLFLAVSSPRLIGHGFINAKDIPFWTAYAGVLWSYLRIWTRLWNREFVWTDFFILSGMLGMLIGIRLGGIVWFPYLILFTGLLAVYQGWRLGTPIFLRSPYWRKVWLALALAMIGGYFLGLCFIPYVMESPIQRTIEGFRMLAQFPVTIRLVFEGKWLPSGLRPWYYPLLWMAITIPLGVWAGWLMGVFASVWLRGKSIDWIRQTSLWLILFVNMFPIAYVIYKNSNLYDGWRHLLFTYGPMLLIASWGWLRLLKWLMRVRPWLLAVGLVGLMVFQADALRWVVVHHPYQVVYFNRLIGGIQGAYGRFELDYYHVSMKECAERLLKAFRAGELTLPFQPQSDTIIVATNQADVLMHYLRGEPRLKVRYVRYYQRHEVYWDVAIWYSRFIHPALMRAWWWPPAQEFYSVRVEGIPLATVQIRPSLADYEGMQAVKRNQLEQAVQSFRQYLQRDAKNELVISTLGQILLRRGAVQQALAWAQRAYRSVPDYPPFVLLYAQVLVARGKSQQALQILEGAYRKKVLDPELFLWLGYLHLQQGTILRGIQYLEEALQFWPQIPAYYQLLSQAYQALGRRDRAQYYQAILQRLTGGGGS